MKMSKHNSVETIRYDDIDDEMEPLPEDKVNISKIRLTPKYNIAYFIMVILGLGVLFPWNVFLVAYDYFAALYPDFPFQFALSLAFNYPSIFCLLIWVKYGGRGGFASRIIPALSVHLVVLTLTPFLPLIFNSSLSLWLTLIGTFLTGIATATLFAAVMGLAALFPPEYTGAVMIGNGVAGLISSILRVSTKAVAQGSTSGGGYFWAAAGIICVCLVSFMVLLRLPITQIAIRNFQLSRTRTIGDEEHQALLIQSNKPTKASPLTVFMKIKRQALSVMFVFFVTLSLFPGVISLIPAESKEDNWFQIWLIVNLGRTNYSLCSWWVT